MTMKRRLHPVESQTLNSKGVSACAMTVPPRTVPNRTVQHRPQHRPQLRVCQSQGPGPASSQSAPRDKKAQAPALLINLAAAAVVPVTQQDLGRGGKEGLLGHLGRGGCRHAGRPDYT